MAQNSKRSVHVGRTRSVTMLAVVVVALMLISEADALAYVDPGTGSYLFQLAIAGGLASVYTIRRYWHTLTEAVRRRFGRKQDNPPPDGRHDVE